MGDHFDQNEGAAVESMVECNDNETSTCLAFRLSLTDFSSVASSGIVNGEDRDTAVESTTSQLPDMLLLATTVLGEKVVSAPMTKGEDGVYDFNGFTHIFLRDGTRNVLLNSLVRDCVLVVDVLDAKSEGDESLPIASLSLDLSPLLEGSGSVGGEEGHVLNYTASENSDYSGVDQLCLCVSLEPGTFTITKSSDDNQNDENNVGDVAVADENEPGSGINDGQFTPMPLLSDEEGKGSVIVTTKISTVSPMPSSSSIGYLFGSDEKDDSGVIVNMGIASFLPCGPVTEMAAEGFASLCSTFSIDTSNEQDSVSPIVTSASKTFVSSSLKDTIIEKLVAKEPLLVEMMMMSSSPSLPSEKASETNERMHAIASIDLSPLLEPGSSTLTATVPFIAPESSSNKLPPLSTTPLLPCFSSSPASISGDDSKTMNSTTNKEAKGNLWTSSSSSVCLELVLSGPLIPPWEAPSKPSMTVDKLIPSRSSLRAREPLDEERGVNMFGERVQEISRQMCEVYMSSVANLASKKQQTNSTDTAADGSLSESEKINRRRALIYELNKSGAYVSMKDSLKSSVMSIVREKFGLSGNMSRDEMSAVYNDLYVLLSEKAHSVLNSERAEANKNTSIGALEGLQAEKKEDTELDELRSELNRLKDLADEVEAEGDFSSATTHHQSRLATANRKSDTSGATSMAKINLRASAWCDYGAFCMRSSPSERAKAEECFRESLQCCADADQSQAESKTQFDSEVPSLILLAGLLMCDGILEQAEVYAYRAMELKPSACTWSLLALLYDDLGRVKERDNSLYMSKKLALSEDDSNGSTNQKALELTLLLLDAHLHELASRTLEQAKIIIDTSSSSAEGGQPAPDTDETDALLCQARCDELAGNLEEAGTCLRKASVAAPAASKARVLVMLGKHYASLGSIPEAIASLESALKIADGFIPLDAYMKLCALHSSCGNFSVARVRYLDACRSCPCCSTWLGAGVASYRLGLLHDAEMCLSEANVLDNYRPNVWGYLALVSLAAGRPDESAQAIRLAIQNGIKDAGILAELGDINKSSGKTVEAVRLYRLASACVGVDSSVFQKLGEALVSTRDFKRAREALVKALELHKENGVDKNDIMSMTELVKTCDLELGIEGTE